MKNKLLGVLTLMIMLETVRASVYYEPFTVTDGTIAHAPSASDFMSSASNIPMGDTVVGLTVTLNITSDYYGSLYAQLTSPSGTVVVSLLGSYVCSTSTYYGIGGSASDEIGNTGSGTVTLMLADGEMSIPAGMSLSSGTYSASESSSALSDFNGSSAHGPWNLLMFGVDGVGSDQNTLISGSLNINVVPEPVTQALIIFGAVSLLIHFGRWCRLRLRDRRLR
jgi:subtilisin-like proprotein convertase family protein